MMTTNLIKEVIVPHEGYLKWRICEIGTGCSVANAILSVDGGSDIIYDTHATSSKEAIVDASYTRTSDVVSSLVFCASVLERKEANLSCNAVFISTFIIEEGKATNGWIGISFPGTTTYYNIVLKNGISRKDSIRRVGDIGVILMAKALGANVIEDLEIVDTRNGDLNPIK
tara:strand:- start:2000 stop:2512 length:513 start_codon:yes stop_codon:yes gene_type:complete